jgi:hypothetical protein
MHLAAADLSEGGKAHSQWAGIESGLIERAKKQIAITTHVTP